MPIRSLEELLTAEVGESDFPLIPIGFYNGVITGAEVRQGGKAPYINVRVTIHDEGEYRGQNCWKNAVSFSEKALLMPGGPAQLAQATGSQDKLAKDVPWEEAPSALAAAVLSTPVRIEVRHEQAWKNGSDVFNEDGTPKMRAIIHAFAPADEDFIASVEAEAAGLDDDLPF